LGLRLSFFGDELERIVEFNPLTGEILTDLSNVSIYPAKHFITEEQKLESAIEGIEYELVDHLTHFQTEGKHLEAQRIEQRTKYDLEMLREVGYCSGIENYSRHLDQRPAGSPPWTLIDYFPQDYLLVVDEGHMTIPQVRGMFKGDRSRKETLVEFGFRLPSALDNRPLTFEEFETRVGQVIYTSATPGPYELGVASQVVEQIIRPTGLVDPQVEVRPVTGQIDDLVGEIQSRHYLHSEVDTIERVGILRDLRLGVHDVVVGINLLREGLDLPEVSLVAILDADKEGFLRSGTALIQTIGRASRHVEGRVIMYADRITDSMRKAIDETDRRREIQIAYNQEHGIQPESIVKEIRDLTDQVAARAIAEEGVEYDAFQPAEMPEKELVRLIDELEDQMRLAAENLEFEKAAALRDQIFDLRAVLMDKQNLPPWLRARALAGQDEPLEYKDPESA
jgi:excinuclease ABC subunit B